MDRQRKTVLNRERERELAVHNSNMDRVDMQAFTILGGLLNLFLIKDLEDSNHEVNMKGW